MDEHVVDFDHNNSVKASVIHLVSGMCAGCVNVVVGLPMDTVKVKMQTFPKENNGVIKCFTNVVSQ